MAMEKKMEAYISSITMRANYIYKYHSVQIPLKSPTVFKTND